MIANKKVVVVLPAYNAMHTLEQTYNEIPFEVVDEVVLVDDNSTDQTIEVAQKIGIKHIVNHEKNIGYGGNQKSCYKAALELGADIVVMLHPDYQYTPKLIESMCYLIANDVYPVVFGSRILGSGALKGGMPLYKFIANRFLTNVVVLIFQQFLLVLLLIYYTFLMDYVCIRTHLNASHRNRLILYQTIMLDRLL